MSELKNDLECFELRFKNSFDAEKGKLLLEVLIDMRDAVKEELGIELEIVGLRKSRGGKAFKPISADYFKGTKLLLADATGKIRSVKHIIEQPINLAKEDKPDAGTVE